MSISLEIEGKIQEIFAEQQVTEKFKKRDFVVLVENQQNPQYNDEISIQFAQDKCEKLNDIAIGDKVKVFVNIQGRSYNKKDGSGKGYMNTISAWKIEVTEKANQGNDFGLVQKESVPDAVPEAGGDDLPF